MSTDETLNKRLEEQAHSALLVCRDLSAASNLTDEQRDALGNVAHKLGNTLAIIFGKRQRGEHEKTNATRSSNGV